MPPFESKVRQVYRAPVLLPTWILNGEEFEPVIPAPVGADAAVNITCPRFEGLQTQLTEWLEPEPVVDLFLHPGNILLLIRNVIFDATLTVAVMTTAVLKVAVVAPLAS